MYFYLTRAIKRRIIHELKDSFSSHPVYKEIVPYISSRMPLEEIPQYGIIVTNASASKVQFSADNFVGTVKSYCQKANVEGKSGQSLEWIREDQSAILRNGGNFPSPPGIYYLNFQTRNSFFVDSLLQVSSEVIGAAGSIGDTYTCSNDSIHAGSFKLFLNDTYKLVEGVHYTINYSTGTVTQLTSLAHGNLYAHYYYPGESSDEITIEDNTMNNTAIPGVILAFGRAMEATDTCAIVVTPTREISSLEYGGKWAISLSLTVLAMDPIKMEEISDLVLMTLWGVKKDRLEYEGIVLQDISHGGEADEVYDEVGQNPRFQVSMDLSLETDWSIHVPVPFQILHINYVPGSTNEMTDEEIAQAGNLLNIVPSIDPYMATTYLSRNFERIV